MKPLISVIVPVYKVEKELPKCVESIINQTYTNLEIILVDDGSPDDCGKICDFYKNKDKRIKVIHKENGGLSDARNFGLKAATGEFVMFIDSDDYILLDSCSKFIEQIDNQVEVILGEATIHINNKEKLEERTNLKEDITYDSYQAIKKSIEKNQFYAPVCYNMYRRVFLLKNNLYFKTGILHEDMEILPRIFLSTNKIKCLRYPFYQYVIREDSITQQKDNSKNIQDMLEIYAKWKEQFDILQDKKIRKLWYSILSKYIITTFRKFKIMDKRYPKGINAFFLIKNTVNFKEFIKTISFICFRKIYVRL